MVDSLQIQSVVGTPEPAARLTIVIILAVIFAIGLMLVYFKIREKDEEAGL